MGESQGSMRMGANARTKAERDYSPAVHMERLDALYAEAATRLQGVA